jgi:hypothetical protein
VAADCQQRPRPAPRNITPATSPRQHHPGDITIERNGFRLYIPVATSLLIGTFPCLIDR